MVKEYKILIDGKWIKSDSGETFESANPATEKVIGRFQSGTKSDVDKAVEAAEKALDSWREFPARREGRFSSRPHSC